MVLALVWSCQCQVYWSFKWMPLGRSWLGYFAIGAKNKNLAGWSGIGVLVVGFSQIGALKSHAPLVFNFQVHIQCTNRKNAGNVLMQDLNPQPLVYKLDTLTIKWYCTTNQNEHILCTFSKVIKVFFCFVLFWFLQNDINILKQIVWETQKCI